MKKYIVEIEVYDDSKLEYLENTIYEALYDGNVDCTFEVKEVEAEEETIKDGSVWISQYDELPNAYKKVEILMNNGDIHVDMLIKGKYGNLEWRDYVDSEVKAWRKLK